MAVDYTGYESAFVSTPTEDNTPVIISTPVENKSNDDTPAQKTNVSNQPTPGQESVLSSNATYEIKSLPNPLGDYSSYTYQITLYMSTPDAINRFVQSGRFDPRDDHYIVAQSGGLNVTDKRGLTNTGELGPGQLGLDYYIDDLELKHVLTGTDGSPTVGTDIRFKIIEPIGFNFFTQLSTISEKINDKSDIIKQSFQSAQNSNSSDAKVIKPAPLAQNYMIGIRFFGYDSAGNLVSFKESANFFNAKSTYAKSAASDYANFEHFFTFQITNISYQIDGRVVTYSVEGTPIAKQIGHGTKFGLINSTKTIVAETVGEALGDANVSASSTGKSLMQILQEQEAEKVGTGRAKFPITYKIDWGDTKGNSETKPLIDAKVTETAIYKNMTPSSGVKTSNEATPKAAQAAQSIDTNKKQITLPQGTPVLFILDQIMAKSSYVTEKLIMQNDESIAAKSSPNASTSDINWYSINPIVNITGRDPITKDWVYDITYRIRMQRIEYIRALYVKRTSRWRGVHKEYKFFLTGENTEIINFEQKYDNQFYLLQAMSTNSVVVNDANTLPAHSIGGTTNKPIAGAANRGSDVAADTAIRMNSIADQASASIRILGDPHYLMSNVGGINAFSSSQFQERYGATAETMNPYQNQIWIRILFNGSEDYGQDGTLNIKPVDFYAPITPPTENQKKSDIAEKGKMGIIYRIIEVTSNFNNGRFTQTLELILVGANSLNLGQTESEAGAGRGGQGGPTASEITEWNNRPRSPRSISERERAAFLEANIPPVRRGGTIAELRRNVYVAGATTSGPNDDTNSSNTKNPRQATFGNTTITLIDPREANNSAQVQAQNPPSRP